jgi:DNA modification methylase
MRQLVRLITPPGGTVLDPFAGSGSTLVAAVLEGVDAVGIELDSDGTYIPIINGRVAWAKQEVAARPRLPLGEAKRRKTRSLL